MGEGMKKALLSVPAAAAFALAGGAPLAAAPRAAATQMMSPVLAKMEQAGRNLKTLQAGISQEKIDRTLGITERSSGTFFYKAGAAGSERVLLQYTDPKVQTVAVVGDKVMMYQPDLHQLFVTTRKASAGKNKSLGFLGLAYSDAATQLREKYDVTLLGEDKINGQLATQIHLNPKDKSDGIQGIILWVDEKTWLPVQYFIQEKATKTTITLSGMKPNLQLPDAKFEISYPKNAQVVEG
jgi:outer membrane lipoprotein-sorting protein